MDNTIFDKVKEIDLKKTMETSYIDYAMSVIAARALPDVRDGLKPVQRRILFSMIELNNGPDKPHRKCARIVGDTMGKYHPHGDSSIYEALVKLAQDFNTRYPLVDGHGNFGSVDGDGAAAMRYTEARLSKISMEMLAEINKDTVDFIPNFDDTEKEPVVLPARYPNLLVNGTSGIAVGMATNIPPHNLRETINAVIKIIDNQVEENRETQIEELLQIVKGPDFPTGAEIVGIRGIEEAYRTGRGKIKVRSVADIETMSNGKPRIIITEIPYMVNKARLIEKIAELAKEKKVEGITDLRDESDRFGMRIVIELRRDVNANVVLNKLYKHTQLMDTFGVIMLALVNNEPKVLNLKDMLVHYLNHQKEVVTRRTRYDLNKAEERAHILQGLLVALDHIDEVISIIRGSRTTAQAKQNLMERFSLSDAQAQAIVDMRLKALTGLEREKLQAEYEQLMAQIAYLKSILADEKKLLGIIKDELTVIRDKFGDDRRTKISMDEEDLSNEDLIPDESVIVTMTNLGYIKRIASNTFRAQNRGGKGIKGMQTIENDMIKDMITTRTHYYMLFFTSLGRVYRMKSYEIPEAGRTARGTAIINLLQLLPEESISAIITYADEEQGGYIMMATKNGIVKKTGIEEYANIRKNGLIAINMREDDELIEVKYCMDGDDIFLATENGMCIQFNEADVRATGRNSMGVKGIDLNEDDAVIAMINSREGEEILFITELGMGKRTHLDDFKIQNRGGKGIKCYRITEKTGKLAAVKSVTADKELMVITTEGIIIRVGIDTISSLSRVTSGVKIMNIDEEKTGLVASIAITEHEEDPEELEGEEIIDGEAVIMDADAEIAEVEDVSETAAADDAEAVEAPAYAGDEASQIQTLLERAEKDQEEE